MPYIGNTAADRFVASKAATQFSGDGSTTAFTLEHSVGSDEDILVSVDGVIQEPSVAYAVSSGTTLTFTAAPSSNSGNNIFVYYLFRTVATVDHPATSALSATSGTFSTDLTVDTSTLKVDSTNNRVGVGTASPEETLEVSHATAPAIQLNRTNDGGFKSILRQQGNDFEIRGSSGTTKIYTGNADGDSSTARLIIDANGHVTMPTQSAFCVTKDGNLSNLSINASTTVTWQTERFDQNSDFSSNTFTAPVTGKYAFHVILYFLQVDADAAYVESILVTSNDAYSSIFNPTSFDADSAYHTIQINVIADMDANDTAYVRVYLNNTGAAQMDINADSFFSGALIC